MKKSFCERLRDLRGDDSQSTIARKLGLSQQSYARYETGVVLPGLEQLHHMCCVLGVSSDWLIGLSDDREAVKVPIVPACSGCLSRDETIKSLSDSVRLLTVEVSKKNGYSESPKHSSGAGARKEA